MDTILRGTGKEVVIGPGRPVVIIGNRIDATANEAVARAVRNMDMALIQEVARGQAEAGADVVGIRVGMEGVDATRALVAVTKAVAEAVPLPICIDSKQPEALEAALRACPGKPLVSSITAEDLALQELLPIAVDRGAAVIGFGVNEGGLPAEFVDMPGVASENVELARLVLRTMLAKYLPREDAILGIPVIALADDPGGAAATLDLIAHLSRIEQLNIALEPAVAARGLSRSDGIGEILFALGVRAGATCAIGDPVKLCRTARVADLLLARRDALERLSALPDGAGS
jgi:5-methyltetrahydrofolate--homocysteine methyltransferase